MIHKTKQLLMTLVALFAMTSGAWAQEETLLTTITPTGDGTYSETTAGAVTVTPAGSFFYSGSSYGWRWDSYGSLTVTANEGYTITRCVFIQQGKNQSVTISEAPFALNFEEYVCLENTSMDGVTSIEVYGTAPAPAIEVTPVAEPAANTKQWTFDMPGSDVVLTPIYAPVAQWATEGDVELLPTAAEGIIAGTDAPLIVEGTVAPGQGTVMYAVTSTNQATAPELSAFSATVPTAENIADEGADLLVWYYIQGADTPDGQEATAENTFNDSEICATPLEVSVLSNQFDITFNAANANTIEAGKATVTVGGTAATVTEGKLEGVKMGSEVKMTAKQGYKFRKVEAKKVVPAPTLKDALADGATVVITYTWYGSNVTTFTYTNNGGTYTGNTTGYDSEYFGNGMSMEGTTLKFSASNIDNPDANVSIDFNTDTNEYVANKGSGFTSFTISVNGTDLTSQLTEVVDETGD